MPTDFGDEPGQTCWRNGCQGVILDDYEPDGCCSCHVNPPCGFCTTHREYCSACDWMAKDEQNTYTMNRFIVKRDSSSWEPRPLDPRKIDYRVKPHTNSSQLCVGVYPVSKYATPLEAKEALLPHVRGTFGGRFNYCNHGKFEYVAYTD